MLLVHSRFIISRKEGYTWGNIGCKYGGLVVYFWMQINSREDRGRERSSRERRIDYDDDEDDEEGDDDDEGFKPPPTSSPKR